MLHEATKTARSSRPRTRSVQEVPLPAGPTDEQIRQRAYEIYIARGLTPGNPDADWHQARLELEARMELLGRR